MSLDVGPRCCPAGPTGIDPAVRPSVDAPRGARALAVLRAVLFAVFLPLVIASAPTRALAQDRDHKNEDTRSLDVRGGLTVADSLNLPGQTEGATLAIGYGFDASLVSKRGRHTFGGSVHIAEGFTYSGLSSSIVKSLDDARGGTSYAFSFAPWASFTTWADVSAPLFASFAREPDAVTFDIARADGLHEHVVTPALQLSEPLLPLLVEETVGFGFRPLDRPYFTLDLRVGLGARHALADHQLEEEDNPHTVDVEVFEQASYHALTPVVEASIRGEAEGRLYYTLDAGLRVPVAHTSSALAGEASPFELTMVDVRADVSIVILPWLTLDYELLVDRNPLLDSGLGVGNRLMLAAHPIVRPVP